MHAHGTAVLTEPIGTTSTVSTGASTRDQWLAKCESQLAAALATRNAELLPVLPRLVFTPDSERCPDCHGTGYSPDFDLCSCMSGDRPAYDFPRCTMGEVSLSVIGMSGQTPAGQLDVWVPCQHCDITPTRIGPYSGHDLIRTPWVPDCTTCNDTGWTFVHHIPAGYLPW